MNDAKEITDDSTPNEVVAYLNNNLQSGESPSTTHDVLTDIQDGELTLPRFNTSATMIANIVNNWLDGSGVTHIVCDGLTKNLIVYTLSEVQEVSGSSLVWWWKEIDSTAYIRLMSPIRKGYELQFLLHEARDNHFMLTETVQKVWDAARSLPIEHSLRFCKKILGERLRVWDTALGTKPGSWENVHESRSPSWERWIANGGKIEFVTDYDVTVVQVAPEQNEGLIKYWQNLIENENDPTKVLDVLQDVDYSGVMSSPSRFPYRDLYSKVKGYREDLSNIQYARTDPNLSDYGWTNIVDIFVTVDENSKPFVYMLSNNPANYGWTLWDNIAFISPYLHKAGWKIDGQPQQ